MLIWLPKNISTWDIDVSITCLQRGGVGLVNFYVEMRYIYHRIFTKPARVESVKLTGLPRVCAHWDSAGSAILVEQ